MRSRDFALGAALLFIAFLTFFSIRAIARGENTGLAVVSLIVLLLVGFGVLGAITSPPDE
jgi:amino acid transporter